MESNHLSNIKLHFDDELLEPVVDTFTSLSNYTVESKILEEAQLRSRQELYWFMKDDDFFNTICTHYIEQQLLEVRIVSGRIEDELSLLQKSLEVDSIHDYIHIESYNRNLRSDEGRIEEFGNGLIEEIRQLGYEVNHERTTGRFMSDDGTRKEYKWWIYIRDSDDNLCPHNVDIIFTENGPYMSGTVQKDAEHYERFRELLTTFSTEP